MNDLLYLIQRQNTFSASQRKQIGDLAEKVHDVSGPKQAGGKLSLSSEQKMEGIVQTLVTDFWPELRHRSGAFLASAGFVANSQDGKRYRLWYGKGIRPSWLEVVREKKDAKR